jgi:hypothetical protein
MRVVVCLIALAACGDNQDPCDFHEADDLRNATSPEATGLVLGGGATSVCGSIDGGHFDPATRTVDVDEFRISVGGSGEVLVQMTADPEVSLLGEVDVSLFADAPNPRLLAEGTLNMELADHAAFVATVPPGDVDVVVTAHASSGVDGALDYRVRLLADPSRSCPAASAPVMYQEAHDGPDDMGNDTVSVDFTRASPFVAISGTPEPTGLRIGGGARVHLAGTTTAAPHGDPYLDRDTYALETGPDTKELGVRLDWSGETDLDFVVFEADTLVPVATSTVSGTASPEFQVFAVKNGARYWLWVGRYGVPARPDAMLYDVNVCGGGFY